MTCPQARLAAKGTFIVRPQSAKPYNSNLRPSFASMKHGIGRLTATHDNGTTQLTQVSHKSPMRWLPFGSSRVSKSGAALAAMSNYGAGLLPGDSNQIEITVKEKARLGVISQGSNRVYTPKTQSSNQIMSETTVGKDLATSTMQATVESGGMLVVAPDPTVPFSGSQFHQQQLFQVHQDASLIAIDWLSSGRFANGERWQFESTKLETKLSLFSEERKEVILWDATTLNTNSSNNSPSLERTNPFGFDLGNEQFNAVASMILYGKESLSVVHKLQELQYSLAAPFTRLRGRAAQKLRSPLRTTGRVLLGVNEIDDQANLYLARCLACSNEELYRMLHLALQPLAPRFGTEFYSDRIRATSTGPLRTSGSEQHKKQSSSAASTTTQEKRSLDTKRASAKQTTSTPPSSWKAYMLADSALPTGSFAHSSGLEAASQLGLLQDEDNLKLFIETATRSALQQATPWIMKGYDLVDSSQIDQLEAWKGLDKQIHSMIVCNAPACRASLDQGKNLLRVAVPWLHAEAGKQDSKASLLQAIHSEMSSDSNAGHLAPLFGLVAKYLDLSNAEACQVLGYCVARDIVSAAVRLNLLGPLASVGVLSSAQRAADEGIQQGIMAVRKSDEYISNSKNLLWNSEMPGACAPVVDAIHPCHDLLAVRLFRT